MERWFTRITSATAEIAGQPVSFVLATLTILVWGITGPIFHWSDTWQLVINTGTTIITFLMVFLIQSAQNRESLAVQIKLDELIMADISAHKVIIGIEKMSLSELEHIRDEIEKLVAVKAE